MAKRVIDLRSDTVTRPSAAMRVLMASADVGDDVFGEDPTVNRLQERVAEILGKEAALFVPSGTMGNQLCIKVHTQPGDEVIAERGAHVFQYETAGAAFLSSVQIHTVEGKRGLLRPEDIEDAIRPEIYYMPKTRLVCLENTHNRAGGTIYPLEVIRAVYNVALARGLSLHLDGARLWNASVATGIAPADYCAYFDSVSVCLSKGLGAPVGSVIAGSASFIGEARHYRKIFGGGMRQAGILAAAGIYALENNIPRLAEDHANAHLLAELLTGIPGLHAPQDGVDTNILMLDVTAPGPPIPSILSKLAEKGVLLTPGGPGKLRAVTHLDVVREDIQTASRVIRQVFSDFA
jgi:threonine aldolase